VTGGYLYFGEATGARILRYGVGRTQVGTAYQFEARTWDDLPGGHAGDAYFREIQVDLRHSAGYDVEVTPEVDGVAQVPQVFTGAAPPAGQAEAVPSLTVNVAARGARLACQVRSRSLPGPLELVNIQHTRLLISPAPADLPG